MQRPESSSGNELRQDSNLGAEEVWGGEGHLKTKSGEVDVRAARGSKKNGGRESDGADRTHWVVETAREALGCGSREVSRDTAPAVYSTERAGHCGAHSRRQEQSRVGSESPEPRA